MPAAKKQSVVATVATGSFLDRIRLASVLTVMTYAAALYCIVADKIIINSPDDFLKFYGGLAAVTAGNAVLGKVRNDAAKARNAR